MFTEIQTHTDIWVLSNVYHIVCELKSMIEVVSFCFYLRSNNNFFYLCLKIEGSYDYDRITFGVCIERKEKPWIIKWLLKNEI